MRRRTVLAGVLTPLAFVLGLTFSACGSDNPKPSPPASTSPSASPSASASVVAPTMPAAAKGTGAEAAKAFVRHYLATFSYAARTGDVSGLIDLGRPSCESCDGVISRIRDTYATGGYATGSGYKAGSLTARSTAGGMTVRVEIQAFEQLIYASPGADPTKVPGTRTKAVFKLTRAKSDWTISDWTRT